VQRPLAEAKGSLASRQRGCPCSPAAGQGSEFGALHFRGRRITAAIVADLLAARGLANATQILVTGDSAGGVGAMNNADWMGGLIRQCSRSPYAAPPPEALAHCACMPLPQELLLPLVVVRLKV
jgi:hypothetical protein